MLLHEFNWKKEVLQAGEPVLVDFCASMTGFMARQGGHHEAQKSTSTGSPACRTSFFQLNSCSSIGLLA